MITIQAFQDLVRTSLEVPLNSAQLEAIRHEGADVLQIVAGPGSGKTTVLVLRALRHVFVDDILPENMILTTFTKKAAKVLRTRWIEWGTELWSSLLLDSTLQPALDRIDINRCRIDTLDSICQEALTQNKVPGEIAPIVVEESASKILLKRESFGGIYSGAKDDLDVLFARYTFEGDSPRNNGEALAIAKTLCDRLIQDQVNLTNFASVGAPQERMVDILNGYHRHLRERNVYDYPLLSLRLLERVKSGELDEWVRGISALLIDEYQDTNPLQEALYFQIISSGSPIVTIVGDDDQAMYRFRGGSVELFTKFSDRLAIASGKSTTRIDMVTNYRSSSEIVKFYNDHITGDPEFTSARVQPSKPQVIANRGELAMPVLGMFRESPTALADSLASWIASFLLKRSANFRTPTHQYEISLKPEGNLGDFVVLAHTVNEITYNSWNGQPEIRFPGFLRQSMESKNLQVFNPRGRALRTIASVRQLLGLIILCLDPSGNLCAGMRITNEARFFLTEWRNEAEQLVVSNPKPRSRGGIQTFIGSWQNASQGAPPHGWPSDWPILELIFTLIAWMPEFQADPEHQVWLEAITRIFASVGIASPYGMQIFQEQPHRDRSRESLIRDGLVSIAEDESEVDEDIMPSVPRDRLQLMTIHQAKGLEFPLVIVDVGSHFKTNNQKQAFRRFPLNPSNVVTMEDDVEPHLQLPLRSGRSPLDRSFDDLARLYYVAYSRPQSVLMLIGCEGLLSYGKGPNFSKLAIPNIALGWSRLRSWPWRQSFAGRRPPVRVEPPLILI